MKKHALLALALAAGCDHGDGGKPPLQLKKETIRRLDAGSVEPIPVSSPVPTDQMQPQPVSSPAPQPVWDAGVPDASARRSPPTNQAPHTNQKPR